MTRVKGPGPKYQLPSTLGMVNHDPTRPKAPGYSFGARYSNTYRSGPDCFYYIESGLYNNGRENHHSYSIYGRPKRSIWEATSGSSPGPIYAVNPTVTERRNPSYSFGGPFKHSYKTDGPGPNSYNVLKQWGSEKKGPLISGRSKDFNSFDYDFAKTPGPATYKYTGQEHGPAFSMGHRTYMPGNKFNSPGPNTYLPAINGVTPRSPRFTMGIRHHEDVMVLPEVED